MRTAVGPGIGFGTGGGMSQVRHAIFPPTPVFDELSDEEKEQEQSKADREDEPRIADQAIHHVEPVELSHPFLPRRRRCWLPVGDRAVDRIRH